MITEITLQPGVTLRCFTDNRFKQGCLSLQLLRPMRREEAGVNAMIPTVLLRGCESAPDLRQITGRLDDLYGASVGPLVRQMGDYQGIGFYASFISDRYALQGDKILAPMVAFLEELLLRPVLEDGVFSREFVESEKKNLISTLESRINDKRSYATGQMIRKMCKDDPYGISRLGETEDVAAITAESAYAQYKKILATSQVELWYVGEEQPERVAELLKPLCAHLAAECPALPAQTSFKDGGSGVYTEEMDIKQARLCLGLTTPVTIRSRQFAAMQVCNMILGGGMTSKLFMNVREKLSLCYDVASGYRSSKGIVLITAGVEGEKLTVAREEILRQLDACKQGDITEEELVAAKQGLISTLQGVHDSPGGIEDYYSVMHLTQARLTPQEYLEAVEQVDKDQVVEAARTLTLHTEYVLKGVQ